MVRLYRNESSDSSSSTISDNVIKRETSTVNQARDPLCPLDPNQMFIMSGKPNQNGLNLKTLKILILACIK